MKNKLALLGFLSLLGPLGFLTPHRYFLGFFAYAVFFRYWGVVPDELFTAYLEKSAARAFFAGIAVQTGCTLVLGLLLGSATASAAASALATPVALVVFAFTLARCQRLEQEGLSHED